MIGLLVARGLRRDRAPPLDRRRACSRDGGASRGNLLSGEADEAILTVSRIDAEKRANPGYRAFLANGFNVTRTLVLFFWEVVLEWTAAARQQRRDVRPRGHRGGIYPFLRGRDVRVRPRPDRLRRAHRHDARAPRGLRDVRQLRRGRPPLRARAGRHDGGAAQARPAVRPHRARAPLRAAPVRDRRALRPRADPGRDVQAAPRLRARRARRALARAAARWPASRAATSSTRWSATRVGEATGRAGRASAPKNDVSGRDVVVLGSGNLGLVYLMEEPRRLTLEEIERAPPASCCRRCASTRTSAGCSCARPSTARSCSAATGARYLDDGPRRGRGPARAVLPDRRAAPAAHRRLRARRRHHGRQLLRPGRSTRAARSRS